MSARKGHFLIRNRSFSLVWLGQICSQAGGRMYQMAMIWWILGLGGDSPGSLVGLFMVMAALPSLLLVKRIGRTIDQRPSQRLLVTCDVLASITVSLVALALHQGWLMLPFAYVAGLIAACLQAFIDPTLNKAVGDVVEKEDYESAVGLLASTQSLANFAGAVAGALLIEVAGIWGTAALAACGYAISASATALARFRPFVASSNVSEASAAGWAILTDYPLLKKILIGFGFINFFATPTLVVLPIYVKRTLGATASTLGQLEACLWVGLIVGTALAGRITMASRVRLGAICVLIFGMALAVPGIVTSAPAYGMALFVGTVALGINNVKFISLFQETVAPEIKGRFFALMQAILGFTFPIAYFLFGSLTDYLSPPLVCLVQGVGTMTLALYFLRLATEESLIFGLAEPAIEGA